MFLIAGSVARRMGAYPPGRFWNGRFVSSTARIRQSIRVTRMPQSSVLRLSSSGRIRSLVIRFSRRLTTSKR